MRQSMLALSMLLCLHSAAAQTQELMSSYQAHMAAAEKSLRLGEARELRRWLDAAPEGLRGWEWRYLDGVSDTSQRAMTTPRTPTRVAVSPSGDRVATVEGSVVRLWTWPGLEPAGQIDGHSDAVYRAEFDATGARIITVSRDVTSRTWDAASGVEIARVGLSNPAFAAATFSPDGRSAATCAWERDEEGVHGVVWIWDAGTGEIREKRRVGIKPLSSIRYTPDGARLLVGSWDGLVHVLDPTGREVARITLPDRNIYNAVNDIAISPDGRMVAAGTKDRTASIFRIESGELVSTLEGHGGYVEGVAFSADGLLLLTASGDATARLWRVADWSPAATMRGHTATVRGGAFAGRSLITCSLDGSVREWNLDEGHGAQVEISTGVEGTYSAAMAPDGGVVASACFDGTLRLADAASGRALERWEAHPGSTCHAAEYSADGSRLITCSWDKSARVWREPSHELLATLGPGDGVYSCDIAPDGSRAATSGSQLVLWDVDTAAALHRIGVEGATPRRAAFSGDGGRVACGWSDGKARVYEVASGAMIAELSCGGVSVETAAFSSDGGLIVAGDDAGTLRCFTARGDLVWERDIGDRGISHAAISGDRVAAGTDGVAFLDLGSGAVVMELRPLADSVYHLSWSADGSRLAACSTNGTVAVLTAR